MTDPEFLTAAIKLATEMADRCQRLDPDDPKRLRAERMLRELKLQRADQQDANADPGDLP